VHVASMEVDDRPRLRRTSHGMGRDISSPHDCDSTGFLHGMGHDISPPRDCDSMVSPAIANF